jgi:hypothetical protein
MIVPIFAIDHQNVDIAVKLSMLKSVIEDVELRSMLILARVHFGESSGIVSFCGNVDRNGRLASNQQRLISKFFRRSIWRDAHRLAALPAIATRKYINVESACGEQSRKRDGERSFAGAAGGEIANANHRVVQAANRFPAAAKAKFA